MNKIYKVVWSKVKHCYVVTSELAKSQTKGCGARSLRMATVSLGVAASLLCFGAVLPIFGESVAEARGVKCDDGNYYYDDNLHWNDSPKAVTLTAETVTVVKNSGDPDAELYCFGNISHNISGNNDVYKVNIVKPGRRAMKAMEVDGVVAVCYDEPFKVITQYPSVMTDYDSNKDVSGYSITINNTSDNSLHTVYGGYSKDGNVSGNTATITNGKITDSVYGGYSSVGNVSNNTVNLNGGSVMSAYGGYTQGGAAETNHVVVDGGVAGFSSTGPVAGSYVYGGYSKNESGESKDVTGNTVTVKKGTVLASIFGGHTEASGSSGNSGDAVGNIVTIEDGMLAGNMYGGYSSSYRNTSGKVEGNKINITGGVLDKVRNIQVNGIGLEETAGVGYIYGGYTNGDDASGIAKDNEVTISGGALRNDTQVIGGHSNGNNAEQNKVEITEKFTGTVGNVTGGEADKNATKNEVTISGGTVSVVRGGYSANGGIVGGDNADDGNKVFINGGTVGSGVQGGFSTGSGSTGMVKNNTVKIIKGTVNGIIYGGYGWSNSRSASDKIGDVSYNKVEISGGTVSSVYGGQNSSGMPEQSGKAEENTVSVSGDAELTAGIIGGNSVTIATNNHVSISGSSKVSGIVRGGYSSNSRTDYASAASAKRNDVTISDNAELSKSVYGGYSNVGTAESNVVTIKGGTINVDSSYDFITGMTGNGVYGGFSQASGDATKNNVTVEGGTVNAYRGVYGGWAKNGTAGGASADDGNKVNISGGTVSKFVYGGYSDSGDAKYNTVTVSSEAAVFGVVGGYSNTRAVTDNKVTITGGTINNDVYGGSSKSGAVTGNPVSISGGTVTGDVYGGYSATGNSTKNSVIISGGTFNGQGNDPDQLIQKQAIFGGYNHDQGSASENTVTISGGTFIGSKGILIQGGRTYYATGTTNNNTVNLTGTVTGLEKGSLLGGGSSASNTGNELHVGGIKGGDNGVWQGKTGDTVNNKVAYVANFDKVVLHSVKWDKDVAALEATTVENVKTLDITNIQFDQTPSSGESMALLKSGSDISSIKLTYKGGTNETITPAGIIVKGGSGEQTEATGVNGVKLTTKGGSEKVSLPDVNTILYSFEAGKVNKITFGTFDSGKEARDLSGSKFEEGNTIDAAGLSFSNTASLLKKNDAITLVSKATGMVTSVTNGTGKTIGSNFTDDNKIQFTTEAKGDVTSTGTEVKYTVTDVTLKKVDLTNWNGTTSDMSSQTAGWTLKAGETVATGDLAKADLSDLKPGDTKTILTAGDSVKFTNDAIAGNKKWQAGGEIIDTAVNGVKIEGTTTGGGVKVDDSKANQLVYQQSKDNVTKVTLSGVPYTKDGTARAFGNAYDLTNAGIDATAFKLSNLDDVKASMKTGDTMIVVDAEKAIANAKGETLQGFTVEPKPMTVDFKDEKVDGKELTFEGTHKDTLSLNDKKTQVVYKVGEKEVNKAIFTGEVAWNDSETYYDAAKGKEKYKFGATDVDATNLKVAGTTEKALKKGDAMTLISATGLKAGKVTQPKDSGSIAMNYSEKGITLAGNVAGEVKAADNAVKYEVTGVNVNKADIGSVAWQKDATLVDFSDKANNFAGVTTIGTDKFAMTYAKPEDVAANDSMTLLKANESLQAIISEEKAKVEKAYSVTPVDGVTVNAKLTSNVANTNGNVMVTVANNQASELKFDKVEWTGDTPLLDHSKTLKNVSFVGATVDTSNIDFYKEMYIEADQTTTLVSDFGGNPKDIKGTTYKVGTAFDGEGSASMENGNLIFRTKTSAGVSEQTHKAVMGVEATMGLLASGIGHLDKVLDGLGNASNAGSDGVSTSASIGGGKDRYETGSHVNINSWNAAVGVGARKEMKKGTLQYGIFGEYGKGSYTMHSDVGRSDGDAHYAGGGLMAKWTNKHDVYTEASFRLGRVSDSANDLLRDGAGNAYGYDIHATYYGAHVGLGKVFNYKGGKSLDVYGKFFYTKRDGAEFDAKQHYNLDSVNSSVLRIGARYGTTDKKWNWYGGLAYEYEFDGEAKGTVNGTEIRAASIKGSSVRGEFGMRMDATKDNPWRTDISIYGYGGKHRGFGGSVNVAYTF